MFFNADDFSKTALSMEHFREWANSVASSYLNSGIEPTTSVVKIAKAENLTPNQVKVLASEANKVIHQTKYASEDVKYHAANFPLADAAKAVAAMQVDSGTEKVAFEMKAPVFADKGPDAFEMFGVTAEDETHVKTASVKNRMKVASEKANLLKNVTSENIVLEKVAAVSAEKAFIKTARQVIIQNDSAEDRMRTLGFIDHFTKQAGFKDISRKALAKLAFVLGKEGLILPGHAKQAVTYFMSKSADEKAPSSMISEWLTSKVVNGDHPLYITLKTYRDRSNALNVSENRYQLVDDRLELLGQKARAL